MLCSRIRLTERRYRLVSTLHQHQQQANGISTLSSSELNITDRIPFVRPCTIIKMINSCNIPAITSENHRIVSAECEAPTTGTITTSTTNSATPRSHRNNKSLSNNNSERTPLIIVSLYMPSEVKTLAPQSIKRDPRRQPLFCQNFQKSSSANNEHPKLLNETSSEFIIRGIEIGENNSKSTNFVSEAPNLNYNRTNLDETINDEQIACCACQMDVENEVNASLFPLNKTEFCLNFDDYKMDTYGNLPRDSSPNFLAEDDSINQRYSLVTRRACSPSTAQVIRITMNSKCNKRKK